MSRITARAAMADSAKTIEISVLGRSYKIACAEGEHAALLEAAAYLGAMLERKPGDPLGGPMHVDGAYNWFRRAHAHHIAVAAVPELGYQRASRTDIHDLRWFDRWPGVRAAVAVIRRIRNA